VAGRQSVAASPTPEPAPTGFEGLLEQLTTLRAELVSLAAEAEAEIARAHPNHRKSARNLIHYLGLRRRDLRSLQDELASRGLSSLGRAESHVLHNLDAVITALHCTLQRPWDPDDAGEVPRDLDEGRELLDKHTEALLGPPPNERDVRIMVTMPSEAATDYTLVHALLDHGMNCMRINCAHDDAEAWSRMIEHLRRAEAATNRSCKVVMDLAGPKLRTGPLEPGPPVVKIRPRRDGFGRVTQPARVWLSAEEKPRPSLSPADACLPVPAAWLADLRAGDRIRFIDARESSRSLEVIDVTPEGCWAESSRTAYVVTGTVLSHRKKSGGGKRKARVGALPPLPAGNSLKAGDLLILTRNAKPGRPATVDRCGQVLSPATIGCSAPEALEKVRAGDRIWFDDGKIGGVVEKVEPEQLRVRINRTGPLGNNLGPDKGINLPDSEVDLEALTAKDVADLRFVVQHADMVALSFANQVEDIDALQERLAQLGGRQPAIVLKIETKRGFENLPALLLAAMRASSSGVMIARGDLAVECGFERLAEVQEEILWLCEAAHVPVIWATQVLETLARKGLPSRAEITDAAMGHRAECVMLNQGPHILAAVTALDDILRRMQGHQAKKTSILRELRLASTFPRE